MDTHGVPVPGAEVALTDTSGGIRLEALSGMDGRCRFPPLPAGVRVDDSYRLAISHLRFEAVTQGDPFEGATLSAAPAQGALAASARIVSRSFTLTAAWPTALNAATSNSLTFSLIRRLQTRTMTSGTRCTPHPGTKGRFLEQSRITRSPGFMACAVRERRGI